MTSHETFDGKFENLVINAASYPITSEESTTAIKNLKLFSECRPPEPVLEPTPDPVPTTAWGKFKLGASRAWDNETTRVLIKAGGSLGGVALVVYTTIHKDTVIERNAASQMNQRPS